MSVRQWTKDIPDGVYLIRWESGQHQVVQKSGEGFYGFGDGDRWIFGPHLGQVKLVRKIDLPELEPKVTRSRAATSGSGRSATI